MKNAVFLWVMIFALPTFADTNFPTTIPNFHQVDPQIFRGARPDQQGICDLRKMGIKTDINLEDSSGDISDEKAYVASANQLGCGDAGHDIEMISYPMSAFLTPHDDEVNQILKSINDPSLYPVFVHCRYGEDRTGLIIGLHRVFDDHYAPADAYKEMLDLGFHQALIFLNHYFETRTGFED